MNRINRKNRRDAREVHKLFLQLVGVLPSVLLVLPSVGVVLCNSIRIDNGMPFVELGPDGN